jgi:hypothetical protein
MVATSSAKDSLASPSSASCISRETGGGGGSSLTVPMLSWSVTSGGRSAAACRNLGTSMRSFR